MLKIPTITLFYKYSMSIHHLQKMLVANLVLRLLGTLLQQDMMQHMW